MSALWDTIDRLSECLERVVTNVAKGAILSQSSSSRHHAAITTEEPIFYLQGALRTVFMFSSSVFFSSVPAAVVHHAVQPHSDVWALDRVTNQHASASPPSVFVGVAKAAQAVAVPSVVPPITALPLPVPPLPISVFRCLRSLRKPSHCRLPRQVNWLFLDRIPSAVQFLPSVQDFPDASNLVCPRFTPSGFGRWRPRQAHTWKSNQCETLGRVHHRQFGSACFQWSFPQ